MNERENATKCRSCRAPMVWLRTSSGGWIPVDDSAEAREAAKTGAVFAPPMAGVMPHHATCPDAAKWRKKPTSQAKKKAAE